MGLGGERETDEDTLCAEYICSLLLGEELTDMPARMEALSRTSGAKFFKPEYAEIFPSADFRLCTQLNRFPFVIRVRREAEGRNTMLRTNLP